MRITRVYTGPDGEAHFEELEIPLPDSGVIRASVPLAVDSLKFVDNHRTVDDPGVFHNAPERQLVVMLSGVHEVRTGTGETRRWGPGEVFLADDTTGHGHTTVVIEPPVRYVFVTLPEDFDPAPYRV